MRGPVSPDQQRIHHPRSDLTAQSHIKAGAGLYDRTPSRVNRHSSNKKARFERAFLKIGTEEGTRTPTAYGHYHLKVACLPIPPPRQNRLLRNALCYLLLLRSLRYVCRFISRLSCIQNRYIFNSWLSLLYFQDRWIRQTNLSHTISFVFSKER